MAKPLQLALPLVLATALAGAAQATKPKYTPGAVGIGDPYFPLDGNGGYEVEHYQLEVQYDPSTDRLVAVATLSARATQDLSQLNLDFAGLELRSVAVDGALAAWSRDGAELTVTPRRGIAAGAAFCVMIAYDGVPGTLPDGSGFIHTADGALVVGEPHVASSWFPANDHPTDPATFTFEITVPEGLQAVANGVLAGSRTEHGWTTWTWEAADAMATYLAGLAIGEQVLTSYEQDGIRYWDAIDLDLFTPFATPTTGSRYASSQIAQLSYKRLSRVLAVPEAGAELSFWVTRDTEPGWDYFFVEAHTPGADDWTTLPDVAGIATEDTGNACPYWHAIHPFVLHYQTGPASESEPCVPLGTSGEWWAATGASSGAEHWIIDLSAYAGSEVEVSLSYASDDIIQGAGVFVDDIVVSTGEGSTSFEDDGDPLDGWTSAAPPEDSPGNENDWVAISVSDVVTRGDIASESLARAPEIIAFLSQQFGPYPFGAAGGIVTDVSTGFALENQTRPIYPPDFFTDRVQGDSVVVHELSHQWFGDSLRVQAWQYIWLNEGFASYAEWLWAEHEGFASAQETFDALMQLPADDPFWSVVIGDPGAELMFARPVYDRGAMTLHALRQAVGDAAFFSILQEWTSSRAGDSVTIAEFNALAEQISGQELDGLFTAWLFTPAKPSLGP
jgi:peptidase M1-like protein